jgi:hypothetical protein
LWYDLEQSPDELQTMLILNTVIYHLSQSI